MIWCCNDCKAPKRFPGCHGICHEYIKQKTIHDQEREAKQREKNIQHGLNSQVARAKQRAIKRKRS